MQIKDGTYTRPDQSGTRLPKCRDFGSPWLGPWTRCPHFLSRTEYRPSLHELLSLNFQDFGFKLYLSEYIMSIYILHNKQSHEIQYRPTENMYEYIDYRYSSSCNVFALENLNDCEYNTHLSL